jgi:hypothetical protein
MTIINFLVIDMYNYLLIELCLCSIMEFNQLRNSIVDNTDNTGRIKQLPFLCRIFVSHSAPLSQRGAPILPQSLRSLSHTVGLVDVYYVRGILCINCIYIVQYILNCN